MSHRNRVLTLILLFACLCWAGRIRGQENGNNANNGAGAAAAKTEETIREQTIYIPYDKLQKDVREGGTGGLSSLREVSAALEGGSASRHKRTEPPKRPVDALINAIENEATIGDQVVNVQRHAAAGDTGGRLGEDPAATAPIGHSHRHASTASRPGSCSTQPPATNCSIEKEGDEPLQLELKLEYTRAFTRRPGRAA